MLTTSSERCMRKSSIVVCTLLLPCVIAAPAVARDPVAVSLSRSAADALIATHTRVPTGGWGWRSDARARHLPTGRDAGAAGIGAALLATYAVTADARYRDAAIAAGDFLLGVAEPSHGGLRWPGWADPDGRRSAAHYTSFDDGAAGISDFLWQLSSATGVQRFRTAALAGMRWLVSRAGGPRCPQAACAWRWTDDASPGVMYRGVGRGLAGIVLTLDAFADRTGDPLWRRYARAGANLLRGLPAPDRADFLDGSAGIAYAFIERYRHDRSTWDLAKARVLLSEARRRALPGGPSGFDLGAAGLAWVQLQAFRVTSERAFRDQARATGRRLRTAWHTDDDGLASGTAGIAWVLSDLARAGIDPAANSASAQTALAGFGWFPAEPSWHLGTAGLAALAAHVAGWNGVGPGRA